MLISHSEIWGGLFFKKKYIYIYFWVSSLLKCTKKIFRKNIRVFRLEARKLHFSKYKKNTRNFYFSSLESSLLKYKKKIFNKKYRSFLSLWLESFISWNIRKPFLEKYKKFFQSSFILFFFFSFILFYFFSGLGWKVFQVALYTSTHNFVRNVFDLPHTCIITLQK